MSHALYYIFYVFGKYDEHDQEYEFAYTGPFDGSTQIQSPQFFKRPFFVRIAYEEHHHGWQYDQIPRVHRVMLDGIDDPTVVQQFAVQSLPETVAD